MSLVLPEPFDLACAGAGTSYGKRHVSWNIEGPGQLARNQFTRCWIDVTERVPMRGEPLWVGTLRWATEGSHRTPFTDAGRNALHALLVPPIARYGFDRLWTELHRARRYAGPQTATEQAAKARLQAAWWDERAELEAMYESGAIELVAYEPPMTERAETVRLLDGYQGRPSYEPIMARLMLAGEQVGWMTAKGILAPMGHGIRDL